MTTHALTKEDANLILEKLASGLEDAFCSTSMLWASPVAYKCGGYLAKIFRDAKLVIDNGT